jgi:N-methylhydantoinase A
MTQIIGIDVGGTNTNAVLWQEGLIVATAVYPTDHQNLILSVQAVLEQIRTALPQAQTANFELHLSTTLTTNAIIEGRGEPAAALIIPGPGVNPADLEFPFPVYTVKGAIDHRGRETEPLDPEELRRQLRLIRQSGRTALAIAGKFAPRNPQQELTIDGLVRQEFPEFKHVTLGHRLSGRLNFPRRVVTALLNASVARLQADFARMVQTLSKRYGSGGPVFILKADGGTMRLAESLTRPIETTLSGPAASIMGALALSVPPCRTAVTLDIGGTTTEIAVLVDGEPLSERDGATIAGYRTLVPALFSHSIGLGGDSRVYWSGHELQIGPERAGPPLALGGPELTPTDAVIALGHAPFGDRAKARQALASCGQAASWDAQTMAEKIITVFCARLAAAIRETCTALNRRPVYTVSEILAPRDLHPEKLIGMGGPAAYFLPRLAATMDLEYQVLPCAAAANAIGAAASRPTAAINLRVDTALGKWVVPELDLQEDLRRIRLFELPQARALAREKLTTYALQNGLNPNPAEIEIVTEEVFNVVREFHTVGKIFALQAQLRPGANQVVDLPGVAAEGGD